MTEESPHGTRDLHTNHYISVAGSGLLSEMIFHISVWSSV